MRAALPVQLTPPRQKNLGEVTWEVPVIADGQSQKATLTANVKAWQNQLVVNKPVGYRQVIRAEDVVDRRTLVDQVSDDPLVTREQVSARWRPGFQERDGADGAAGRAGDPGEERAVGERSR